MTSYPFGRRQLLRSLAAAPVAAAGLHLVGGDATARPVSAQFSGGGVSAEQALQQLIAGNRNFAAGNLTSVGQLVARRGELATSQSPMAAIVACSDSRVPPELVFDQTLGELFVVRTAGQVIDEAARSSIVYAVDYLKAPLVLVVGHSRCGAVDAAIAAIQGGNIPGYAFRLAEAIGPAVRRVQGQPGDLLDNAIRANVRLGVEQIQASEPLLAEDVRQGRLTVLGAHYDFQTGLVTMLS
jgi:carbonic anhydrase